MSNEIELNAHYRSLITRKLCIILPSLRLSGFVLNMIYKNGYRMA